MSQEAGQNDIGLFEANLQDERYLPFEFAGVINDWRLELPQGFNYFDLGTLQVVDLGGVLAIVPVLKDPVKEGAGLLKGSTSLTGIIVEEHHQELE